MAERAQTRDQASARGQVLGSEPDKNSHASAVESFRLADNRVSVKRSVVLRSGKISASEVQLPQRIDHSLSAASDVAALADLAFLRSRAWPVGLTTGRQVRVADLFSGCGVMSLATWEACRAVGASMYPAFASDLNATALAVYKHNFPGATVLVGALEASLDRAIGRSPSKGEEQLVKQVGDVEVLLGGPPCQGHSDLNNHTRRSDPKNALYDRMARFAELVGPTHVMIENVPAALHDRNSIVEKTIRRLEKVGYKVDSAIVEASALGVPQRRRRHVVLASMARQPSVELAVASYRRGERSVGWAIGDLEVDRGSLFDSPGVPTPPNRKRINYLFDRDVHDLPDSQRPDCHKLKAHSYRSVYGRMHWDKPAQTITAGFNCMGQGRFVHPKERRTITPHEAARLQFIPDFFHFHGTKTRIALSEMIANAVPMKLTYALLLDLLR
jgi:DNA (cytosine-5)-methyltransferase 1